LRAFLLASNPEHYLEHFLEHTLETLNLPPEVLGTAFGINPVLLDNLGESRYFRLLTRVIATFYHKRQKLPQYNTIDDAAQLLRTSKKILVITGAGISTSLGIPDFRSKGTGFYSKLLEAGYSEPEEVFEIHNFVEDPSVFYSLARDLLPDEQMRFSPTHAFLKLLQDKGKLLTCYTQNIDNLEAKAGIEKDKLIQCHGSFATVTCLKCRHRVPGEEIFPAIRAQQVARCQRCIEALGSAQKTQSPGAPSSKKPRPYKPDASDDDDNNEDDDIPEPGILKPDIIFFGEPLPNNFFDRFTQTDAALTDLVLVLGTSLKVAPVSDIPNYLPRSVPHIYISRDPVRHVNFDVQLLGDCDAVVFELCTRAGWGRLAHEMVPAGFEIEVEAVEGLGHHWTIKGKEGMGIRGVAEGAKGLIPDGTVARSVPGALVPDVMDGDILQRTDSTLDD